MRRRSGGILASTASSAVRRPRRTDLFLPRLAIEAIAVGGKGYLARADALTFSRALRPEIADVVLLDPPFNLGKDCTAPGSLDTRKT